LLFVEAIVSLLLVVDAAAESSPETVRNLKAGCLRQPRRTDGNEDDAYL
jgi:hypothetical protein